MANLVPENIPTRNDIPERLRTAARLLRDATPEEVLVSLERTGSNSAAAQQRDLGYETSDPNEESMPYLVVFDPAAGVLVLESPTLKPLKGKKRNRLRRQQSVDLNDAQKAVIARTNGLRQKINSLPVGRALALPDIHHDHPIALADQETPRLFSGDFQEGSLLVAIRKILGGKRPPLDEQNQARVRAAINSDIVIGVQGQMFDPFPQDSQEKIRVLDRAQERLAEHLGPGYRLIRGVAGSGKTLVLTHRARFIGKAMASWSILVLCYNKVLAQTLEKELANVQNVTVATIDSLASKVIHRAGRRPSPGNDHYDFEIRRTEARAAARSLSPLQKYDMVLVDEAQDLGNSGLALAWEMGKQQAGMEQRHFIIALDSAQNVYRRKMNWNPPGATARGRSTVLRKNYRNTKQTLDFALPMIAGNSKSDESKTSPDDLDMVVMPETSLRQGQQPLLLECVDLRTEAQTLAKKVGALLRNGATPDNIVVLSGSKDLRINVLQDLQAQGIPAFDAKKESKKVVSIQDKVPVATLQLLKGLEYAHVLIGGINHIWVEDDEDESRQRLLYVAITRATETLTVTYSGDGSMSRKFQPARQ